MFESVMRDPGARGLERAATIFYVIAALTAIAAGLRAILPLIGYERFNAVRLVVYFVFAVLAYVIGGGIIGTVIDIAIIIHVYRASKAGLFTAPPASTVVAS